MYNTGFDINALNIPEYCDNDDKSMWTNIPWIPVGYTWFI